MANVASSSKARRVKRPPGVVQLNDSVWELYNPSSIEMEPEIDIIFFHGLQLGDYKEAFWRTWLSRDNTVVWPKDWLSERFSNARILSISYDSSARKHEGQHDPYVITENLIQDMIQSDDVHVGQKCPVVLVGHSFGGIVIKQFVLGCIRMKEELDIVRCQREVDGIKNFLGNCRGVFYYSTPHLGSRVADYADVILGNKFNAPLVNLLKTLSTDTGRINESFANARGNFGIKTRAMVESLNTNYKGLSATVVEEASARSDIDGILYTAPEANHFDVCKPKDNTTCGIFTYLVTFVGNILQSEQARVGEAGDERQGLPLYPIELESRARDIEKLLMGKAVIGISGMGGIGKTTLAKKVYNNISRHFEYTCFAENVKGIQVRELEDWLLGHFHERGRRMAGDRRQWSDLKGKKTMIVLDDVDSVNQLSVLPTLHQFGKGSCIILTSRDQGVFKFYADYELYEIEFLKADEAKKMFCQHAFDTEDVPNYPTNRNHLKENVEAVVKKCGGLPLTLEVIGRYLRNELDAKVWGETIDKLTKAESITGEQNDRVWASLRVSYEALAKEEQTMFIEAGTYFLGEPLDEALVAWSSISAHSQSRWQNLVSRSMVKEDGDNRVWVHEQLRDLSWSLTKDEIVMGSKEKADELVDQLNAKKVNASTKCVKLKFPKFDKPLQLHCVGDLKELKYLDLGGVQSKGSCKNLAKTLSLLRWESGKCLKFQIPITLIPFPITLIRMTSLAFLELKDCDVPKGFSEALGNLTNLRTLFLSGLRGLDHLPDNFGNLSYLKYLTLEDLDVSELPESFGNLSSLVSLTIFLCKKLASLSSSFGHLTSLNKLRIMYCGLLQCLPDSLSRLSSLQSLDLEECTDLKELGDSFGSLRALENVDLRGTGVERLPHSFSQLSRLQRLSLRCCERLKELGDWFGNLSALKYLDMEDTCIGGLPENFGCLSALEELSCKFNQARLLPDNFSLLTALRYLSIESASLERLPESLGDLARLEALSLEINNVNALPTSLGKLASLRKLYIGSEKLEELPSNFGKLSSLKELTVKARNSVGILTSIGLPSSLQVLQVSEIEKSGDDKLDSDDPVGKLADNFGKLSSLQTLKFQGRGLECLLNCVGELSSLTNMDIDCGYLEELPESLGMLSSLETLKIVGRNLESLPEDIGRLHSLRTIELEVPSIRFLPESINQLSSLRKFLFDCNWHDRMPDHFEHLPFPSLSLVLTGSTSVPEGIGRLCSLQDLTLEFDYVRSLPEELGELLSLKTLNIRCRNLESLPESLGRLSSLTELSLLYCSTLTSLPDSLGRPLGRPSSSQVATPHKTRRSDEEPSFQTTAAGANVLDLTVSVGSCWRLEESTMTRLGWVLYKEDHMSLHYRRKSLPNGRASLSLAAPTSCPLAKQKKKKKNYRRKRSDTVLLFGRVMYRYVRRRVKV